MQKKSLQRLFLFGGVLFFTVILISLVSAQEVDPITTFLKTFWTEWNKGEAGSIWFIKILYTILIGLLVYSVADNLPGLRGENKNGVRWAVAIIVAILSTYLFTQADIYALLLTYSGMGFALGTILPFLILVFFTYDIAANQSIKNTEVRKWLVWILWGSFAVFIGYKWYALANATEPVASYVKPALGLMFIIAVAALIFSLSIIRIISHGEEKGNIERTGKKLRQAKAAVDQLSKFEEDSVNT